MKLILGLVFTVLGLLLVALLVFAAHRLEGQEVLTLPIANHTDSLREGMFRQIQARLVNEPVVRLVDTNGVEAFSVTILAEVVPWKPDPSQRPFTSNVIARIIWKGRTNECVLERNP